ncbi:MAG TPA: argininosuccinate lyase, partial [Actinomycetota bacterium]|nr:argininosuccinate lyase [Actinomycetota bacterium]
MSGPSPRGEERGGPSERALWGGRFSSLPSPEALELGRSLSFDVRLAEHDVRAGVAHVRGLVEGGLLDVGEAELLIGALREVGAEIAAGRFAFHPADEDVHSAVERGVTERLGEIGEKLHAGRS